MSSQSELPSKNTVESADSSLPRSDLDLQFPWRSPPERTLDDVGGLAEIKEELRRVVVRPLGSKQAEYERFGINIPNLLFEGPPGTGKTYTAEALAGELGYPFIVATPARIQSKFVNESGDQIQRLFREAAHLGSEYGHAVIFMDEIDGLLPIRGSQDQHHEDSKVVAELLSYLERSSQNNTLVIGATNRRDQLDPAAVRPGRMDREFDFGYPDRETRYAVLKHHLQTPPTDLTHTDLQQIAVETEGWSSAAVKSLAEDAARLAVERSASSVEYQDMLTALESTTRQNERSITE